MDRRIAINVVTFFVVSMLLVALLAVSVFRIRRTYSVDAVFTESGGVFTGQEVTYRGVTVGRVGDLTVVREGVRIRLVIDQTYDRIPSDLVARVMFKSAVGEQFVDLLPNARGRPYLKNRDVIPLARTELPVQQEELLRLLDAVLAGVPPADLKRLVDTAGEGLGGRGDALHRGLAALDPISAAFAAHTAELNRLAVSGDKAGTAFDATAEQFVAAADRLAVVGEALARANTGKLLSSGARNIPELASLIAVRKAELDHTITGLALATDISYDHIASVDATLKWLPPFLTALINAYDGQRFRFALVNDTVNNQPCDYTTPRRSVDDVSAKAPVLQFGCNGVAGTSVPAARSVRGGTPPPAAAGGSWERIVSDAIGAP